MAKWIGNELTDLAVEENYTGSVNVYLNKAFFKAHLKRGTLAGEGCRYFSYEGLGDLCFFVSASIADYQLVMSGAGGGEKTFEYLSSSNVFLEV